MDLSGECPRPKRTFACHDHYGGNRSLAIGGKRYAERLLEAGVLVSYQHFKGVTHEFFGMGAVVGDATKAVRLVANAMNWSLDDPVFSRSDDRLGRSGPTVQIEPLQE